MISTTLSFDPVRNDATSDGWTLRTTSTETMVDESSTGTTTYHATLTAAQTAQRTLFQADTSLNDAFTDAAEEDVLAANAVTVTNTYNGLMAAEGL